VRKLLTLIVYLYFSAHLFAQRFTSQQYKEDFDYFWKTIDNYYSYWDKKQTDWNKVKMIYGSEADTVTSKAGFVSLLERAFYELYDHHASL